MKFKTGILACVVVLLMIVCLSMCVRREMPPPTNMQQLRTLTIYDIAPSYSTKGYESKLEQITHYELDESVTQGMFSEIRYYWPAPVVRVIDSYLAIGTMEDGTQIRIGMWGGGGAFEVLDQGGYYVMEGEGRERCENMMTDIENDIFIPARLLANEQKGE